MDKRVDEIRTLLDVICTEIVIPLRGKNINNTAFSELFELMDELQELLYNENFIPKEMVEILFFIYTQLDMQASYVETEEVKKEFREYLTKMRSKMRKIFGNRIKQNAGVNETSVKDIMESSSIANLHDVINDLKKLYD